MKIYDIAENTGVHINKMCDIIFSSNAYQKTESLATVLQTWLYNIFSTSCIEEFFHRKFVQSIESFVTVPSLFFKIWKTTR